MSATAADEAGEDFLNVNGEIPDLSDAEKALVGNLMVSLGGRAPTAAEKKHIMPTRSSML